jgi:hypothetical protein
VTAAIHQPQYLPWLPYFDKADQCDVFVHLDTVQYERGGFQNRNRIKTHQGAQWLTVPVRSHLGDPICSVRTVDDRWSAKHAATIAFEYADAPYISWFRDELRPILLERWERLVDFNLAVAMWCFERLGIQCRHVRASELGVSGAKDDLIIGICRALGASVYVSGAGARAYQSDSKFEAAGIELRYQSYRSPTYEQQHANLGFLPELSALDLILNTGPSARSVLLRGRQPLQNT